MTNFTETRKAIDRWTLDQRVPLCRDCADFNGVCPHDGWPCSVTERAKAWLRTALEEVDRLETNNRILLSTKCQKQLAKYREALRPFAREYDMWPHTNVQKDMLRRAKEVYDEGD